MDDFTFGGIPFRPDPSLGPNQFRLGEHGPTFDIGDGTFGPNVRASAGTHSGGPHVHFDKAAYEGGEKKEDKPSDPPDAEGPGWRLWLDPNAYVRHDEAGMIQATSLIYRMPVVGAPYMASPDDDKPIMMVDTEDVMVFQITEVEYRDRCDCVSCTGRRRRKAEVQYRMAIAMPIIQPKDFTFLDGGGA